ncbi:DUF5691 domain-containing protein [Mucilaginibacter ginsenosidivorax]|uniref:Uncharacterized protein n=1 Tax=Mucilaginibacter ginsenosidivorax TaxID=862126 RepID=A0A5B8W8A7_9SPHI|nr:DUF5691 domain-containing protein [Mucilaginibacter ginsenosidivorax]QEC80003.1 hypothetical protein FSB76_30100 [Mucilaginibacter ginsenosidivorax]
MKAWEHVINAAMLGTDKPMPGNADLPDEVAIAANAIDSADTLDKEVKYLQKSALIYNYRQCGFTPLQKRDLPQNVAQPETKPYCTENAAKVLNAILDENNDALLDLWLTLCHKAGQLFLPDVLPVLLEKAEKDKSLRPSITECSGNRGLWLSRLNPAWDYFNVLPDEDIWQTGNPTERAEVLRKVRQNDPQKALEWLQQTWEQENAASKVELLKVLKTKAGPADLPWLESLLAEKGQKVKDEALILLKHIPGSSIVKQYEDLLAKAVTLKKEKAMLGMMTKISIRQELPATVDESIFKSGIEKLAGQKSSVNDEGYIIYQLMASVPPSFWEKQFDATPEQVVGYFEKYAISQIGALAKAVIRFNADSWIPYFFYKAEIHPEFVNKLPAQQRDKYLFMFMDNDAPNTVQIALRCQQEWGIEFAKAALVHMAAHPYQYNRGDFGRMIRLIPVGMLGHVERIEPKELNHQAPWDKNKNYLIKLLGLKQQTLLAFNA